MASDEASYIEFDLEIGTFDELKAVLAYWSAKCIHGIAPSWTSIDLMDLPAHILPRVCVVDVQPEPLDFRYRYWGSGITDLHNLDFTGHSIRDVPPAYYASLLFEQYERVYRDRRPYTFLTRFPSDFGLMTAYVALRLPLSSDGETIDKILTAESYGDSRDRLSDLYETIARQRRRGAP